MLFYTLFCTFFAHLVFCKKGLRKPYGFPHFSHFFLLPAPVFLKKYKPVSACQFYLHCFPIKSLKNIMRKYRQNVKKCGKCAHFVTPKPPILRKSQNNLPWGSGSFHVLWLLHFLSHIFREDILGFCQIWSFFEKIPK